MKLNALALTIALFLTFTSVAFAGTTDIYFSDTGWTTFSIRYPWPYDPSNYNDIAGNICNPGTSTPDPGDCDKVYFFNANSASWQKWEKKSSSNTLSTIESGYGYFIHATDSGNTGYITGDVHDPLTEDYTWDDLEIGWNLKGWTGIYSKPVAEALVNISRDNSKDIQKVWKFDSTKTDLISLYHIRGVTTGTTFDRDNAYWVCINDSTDPEICDRILPPLMPWQNQRPEILVAGWAAGDTNADTNTVFTFSATYRDIDNDAPSKAVAVIDDVEYVMTATGSSYPTGVVYTFNKQFSTPRDYSYYFMFEDGNGHSVKYPWEDHTVTVNAPEPVIYTPSQWIIDSRNGNDIYRASIKAVGLVTHNIKWEYKFRDTNYINGAPAVYDGVLYIGTPASKFYALDAKTGVERWIYTVSEGWGNTQGAIQGTPLVRSDGIYFQSHKGLYALNFDGSLKWVRSDLMGQTVLASNTDRIFVATGMGDKRPGLFAIDVTGGSTIWAKYDIITLTDKGGTTYDAYRTFATPVIFSNNIYTIKYGNLTSYTEDGSLRWENGSVSFTGVTVVNDIFAVGKKGYGNYRLYSFDNTGRPKWNSPEFTETHTVPSGAVHPTTPSAPTISGGNAYVTVGNALYSFKTSDGSLNWKKTIAGGITSSVIAANGNILLKDGAGRLLILDGSGNQIWSIPGNRGMAIVCDTSCYGAPGFMASTSIETTSTSSISPQYAPAPQSAEEPVVEEPAPAISANAVKILTPTSQLTPVNAVKEIKQVIDVATQRFNAIRNTAWENKVKILN
jgi:outer membrane protein assembly factor BamB